MKKTFTILIFVISSITISAQNEAHNIDTMQSENLRKNIISIDILYTTLFNVWGGCGTALNYERYLANRQSIFFSIMGEYNNSKSGDYLSKNLFLQTMLEFRYYVRKQNNKHIEQLKGLHLGPALITSGYFDNEIYKPDNNTLNDRNTPIDEDSYHFYVGLNVGYQFLLKEKFMINLHVCPAYGWRQEYDLVPVIDGSRKEAFIEKKYWTSNFALAPFINIGWAF